ncbi:hypothetical protein AACH06_09085 [Ideonella sp. DXS29W]|uniref:Uncharacterized protein n=1 Tax=Ideonella lacteola TaxID=2984193 RepID=A0ABU9BM92_9BURK
MRTGGSVLLVIAGLVAVLCMAYQFAQFRWYLGALPAQIEVDGVVAIADSGGIREGCGAAVFALSRGMLDRLQDRGMAALMDARQGRARSGTHGAFGAWQEAAPAGRGGAMDLHLSGMDCGGLDEALQQRIITAVAQPGAYVATAQESSLIVIPSLQIVVLSFIG